MRPHLNDLTSRQHKNNIRISYRAQSMRHRNRGSATSPRGVSQRILDQPLALRVECTRRLIEEQCSGIADERSCNGDALSLATGELGPSGATRGIETFGQGLYEVESVGLTACFENLLFPDRIIDPECDVFKY